MDDMIKGNDLTFLWYLMSLYVYVTFGLWHMHLHPLHILRYHSSHRLCSHVRACSCHCSVGCRTWRCSQQAGASPSVYKNQQKNENSKFLSCPVALFLLLVGQCFDKEDIARVIVRRIRSELCSSKLHLSLYIC